MRASLLFSATVSALGLVLGLGCGDEFTSGPQPTGGSGGTTAAGTPTGAGGQAGSGGSDLLDLGEACTAETQCSSGFCVDGYCCENACDETCRVCDRAVADAVDGQCRPAVAGEDPADECGDGVCDGAAGCALGTELFAQACGDFQATGNQLALDVAVDSQGDLIVVGYYTGDLSIGARSLPASNSGSRDAFIAKVDGDSYTTLWAIGVGGAGDDDGRAVTVDGSDNIYVVGAYQQAFGMDPLNPQDLSKRLPDAGSTQNAFIASYDPAGNHRWSHGAGSSATNTRGNGVAVLSDGDLVYVGDYTGATSVGGTPLLDAGTTENIFVARLQSSDGGHQHSVGYGGTGKDVATAVAATSDGSAWVAGYFAVALDFTPSGSGGELNTSTTPDAFLAKLQINTSSFEYLASQQFAGAGSQTAFSVAVNTHDEPHVIGEYDPEINIDGTVTNGQGSPDVFVARVSADGQNVIWAKHVGDGESVSGLDIDCDPQGMIYVTGDFAGQIDLGGGPLLTNGSGDAFIAKYHANGTHLWSRSYGNGELQSGLALAPDRQHGVWLTGKLLDAGPVSFGQAGALSGTSGVDFFLLRIGR
ncbi:MAG: hypothetical protein JRI23_01230 [Deltaproteobacteria bacterium]|nr:hypothetical protein [Deltaproteobacteria bacterium]MBW2530077.1 hypothetical protein [Deltaproteobacteria bacterium]